MPRGQPAAGTDGRGFDVSFLDKIRDLIKGRSSQVKGGIDKGADFVGDKVGDKHAAKVDNVAEKAKDGVDKLAGN